MAAVEFVMETFDRRPPKFYFRNMKKCRRETCVPDKRYKEAFNHFVVVTISPYCQPFPHSNWECNIIPSCEAKVSMMVFFTWTSSLHFAGYDSRLAQIFTKKELNHIVTSKLGFVLQYEFSTKWPTCCVKSTFSVSLLRKIQKKIIGRIYTRGRLRHLRRLV